jgi:hypothetical protein
MVQIAAQKKEAARKYPGGFRGKSDRSTLLDRPTRPHAGDQTHNEQHEKHEEQNLRDFHSAGRNREKPEQSGNQCHNEENQCPVQHDTPPFLSSYNRA